MAHENFRIRIRKDGAIQLLSRDIGEERLRELREMIEDSLGPIRDVQIITDSDDLPPANVTRLDEEKTEEIQHRKI
ncbi:TPA: hypothetical protein DDW35_13120 [Candidatus Sumerlaeota bacterium]|nr:hypothetical protein [Candidatus Sumerlaeota bacterium]